MLLELELDLVYELLGELVVRCGLLIELLVERVALLVERVVLAVERVAVPAVERVALAVERVVLAVERVDVPLDRVVILSERIALVLLPVFIEERVDAVFVLPNVRLLCMLPYDFPAL